MENFSFIEFLGKFEVKKGPNDTLLSIPTTYIVPNDANNLSGDKLPLLIFVPPVKKNDVSLKDWIEYNTKSNNVVPTVKGATVHKNFLQNPPL